MPQYFLATSNKKLVICKLTGCDEYWIYKHINRIELSDASKVTYRPKLGPTISLWHSIGIEVNKGKLYSIYFHIIKLLFSIKCNKGYWFIFD